MLVLEQFDEASVCKKCSSFRDVEHACGIHNSIWDSVTTIETRRPFVADTCTAYSSQDIPSTLLGRLHAVRGFVFDMDGTLVLGDQRGRMASGVHHG